MAGETENFKVSLIADSKDLDNKISKARSQMDKFSREQKDRAKVRFTATIADLQLKMDKARSELRKFKKDGDKAAQLKARIEIIGLQKNVTQARKMLSDLEKTTTKSAKGFFNLNGIVRDSLKAFGGFFILSQVKRLMDGVFNSVVAFDSAFAGVRKTVDATEEEFAQLSEGFRKLAKDDIPLTVEELLKIGELGGQLGIAKEELIEFTSTVAKLGVTTNLTTEDAAKSFARLKNVFRLTNKDVEKLGSSLVDLGNNVVADEAEILSFANRLSGVGNALGLTAQETFGIAAAFRSVGVEAESGGTAIQKALIKMNDVVRDGGKELEIFAKLSGKSSEEFVNTWENDPVQAFNDFVKILSSSGKDASVVIEELIGSNERLKRAFLTIAGSGDLLTQTIDRSNKAFQENTALTIEADQKFKTLQSRIQKVKNFFLDLGRNVGGPASEGLVKFAEIIVDILKGGAKLKEYAGIIKLIGIALGTFIGIKVLTGIKLGLLSIATAGKQATLALTRLGSTKTLMSGLVGAINPIMTIATIALPLLINAWIDSKLRAVQFNNALVNLKKTIEDMTSPFESLKNQAMSINKQISDIVKGQTDLQDSFKSAKNIQEQNKIVNEMGDSVQELRRKILDLGESLGTSRTETLRFMESFGLTADTLTLSQEKIEKITEGLPGIFAKNYGEAEKTFTKTFESFRETTDTWHDAFKLAMDASADKLGKTSRSITETYIKMAGESGEIGDAFMIGLTEGMTRDEVRKNLVNAGIKNIDELIGEQIKKAVEAKDIGKAIPELIALGIDDKKIEALKSSDNLMRDVSLTIANRITDVRNAGLATGQAAGAGIATGFSKMLPILNRMASQAKSIISTLSPQTAENIDSFSGRVEASFGKLKKMAHQAEAQSIQKALFQLHKTPSENSFDLSDVTGGDDKPKNKGGGSGGSPESKAQQALKASANIAKTELKEFEQRLEETTNKSGNLAKRVKDFYSGIASSIIDAKNRQKELTDELDSFKESETTDFIRDIAARNAEIINQEKALNDEIIKIREQAKGSQSNIDDDLIEKQKKLSLLQLQLSEYSEDTKESTKISKINSIDRLQAEIDSLRTREGITSETQSLLDAEKELQKIQEEKSSIDAIAARNSQLSKEQIQEIFDIEKKRASLNDSEREEFDLGNRISEKEAEIKSEIESQEKLIALRTRFLEIIAGEEEKNVVENANQKAKLLGLTNQKVFEDEIKFNEQLKTLGFDKLSEEEKMELLKLSNAEKGFVIEERKLRNQQEALFIVKEEYIAKAETAFFESVDRQKDKIQELINKIREAQSEMKLVGSSGASGVNDGGNTFNINQNNNINSNIDMQSALNGLIQKIN